MPEAALVTGAASGIGRAVAERLVADGWDVLAVDVAPDADGPGEAFSADLTTRAGNRAAVDAALERFGRLDALVPNAGFQHVSPLESFDEDRWDALVALLLTSPFLLARYAWQALRDSGNGRIVVVASVHGLVASPFKAGYVSAKHGVLGLVKALALEGADAGIRASAVCPDMSARRSSSSRSPTRHGPTVCPRIAWSRTSSWPRRRSSGCSSRRRSRTRWRTSSAPGARCSPARRCRGRRLDSALSCAPFYATLTNS